MIRVSASALPRIELCPASAVLPQVGSTSEAADKGSALHQHIRDRAELGIDLAVARLEEVCARWGLSETETAFLRARLMKFTWTPPAGAICELRLAVMPDWTVKRVPEDQRWVEGALFTGQFDVVWAEPSPLVVGEDGSVHCPAGSVLWALDVKGGQDRHVTTIERNLQVAFYAWAAARWTKAQRAIPAICYPGAGEGEWDVPGRMWGPAELDAVEARLKKLWGDCERQERALAEGQPLSLTEGRHCGYCPAQTHCPAKTALLKSLCTDSPAPLGAAPLTASEATRIASSLVFVERFLERARSALRSYVEDQGPIDLGDGVVWGPQQVNRTEILPEAAREVLEEELGEHANAAIKLDITGASIERAIKAQLEARGLTRGVAPTKRRIWAKLGEAGALVSKSRTEWKAHRPEPGAPAVPVVSLAQKLEASLERGADAQAEEGGTVTTPFYGGDQ